MATASQENETRTRRHVFQGVVISDKADKTRVVVVQRQVRHPFYDKIIRKKSKFYVHDEGNESHMGDLIEIMGTRPLSKLKRWRLVKIVKAAPKTAVLDLRDEATPAAPKAPPKKAAKT